MRALPRGLYYGWLLVLVLGVTETVSWGVLYYALSAFVDPMSAELGWSRGQIGAGLSVMIVVSGLFGVLVGRWLDDHGPRWIMTLGSAAGAVFVVAWSQVQDLPSFYAVWALIGMAFAAVNYAPAFATVTVWFRRLRSRALTAITLMAGLSSTIFIPLAALLIVSLGWRTALVVLAAILAVTVPLHALVLRRRPSDLGLRVDGDAAGDGESPTRHEVELGSSLREALRAPSFTWLAAAFALFGLSYGVPVHLVVLLQDRGDPLAFAAVATGAVGAAQVLGRIAFAPLERLGQRRLAAITYLASPLALVALVAMPGALGVWTFVALFGAARGIETLLRPAIIVGRFGVARFASISSVLWLFTTVTQAASPAALGLAYDLMGSYVPALWVLAGVLTVSAVAVTRAIDAR